MPNTNGISGTNNNKDSKPRTKPVSLVVLTYSVSPDLEKTLITLNNRGASVHYIIEENGKQNQFTNDATDITFCCGKSEFRGQSSLNEISINMMLINNAQSVFQEAQITKLIDFLQDLAQRYPNLDLKKDIAGLGEVAVQKDQPAPRHKAPGRDFPWEELAKHGFGLFLSTTSEQKAQANITPDSSEQEILALQNSLKVYGYAIKPNGVYDEPTKEWINRFNTRYVPDATERLDPSIWSEASQLSLDHILNYLQENKKIETQTLASAPIGLFKPTAPAANTEEASEQTATLSMK